MTIVPFREGSYPTSPRREPPCNAWNLNYLRASPLTDGNDRPVQEARGGRLPRGLRFLLADRSFDRGQGETGPDQTFLPRPGLTDLGHHACRHLHPDGQPEKTRIFVDGGSAGRMRVQTSGGQDTAPTIPSMDGSHSLASDGKRSLGEILPAGGQRTVMFVCAKKELMSPLSQNPIACEQEDANRIAND